MGRTHKKKAGRPRRTFTEKEIRQIEQLAACYCSDQEIASYLDCGENTLKRHFGPLLKKGRERAKRLIRATQFKVAIEKQNVTLLIWLGKQTLGQRDDPDPEELNPPPPPQVKDILRLPNGMDRNVDEKKLAAHLASFYKK